MAEPGISGHGPAVFPNLAGEKESVKLIFEAVQLMMDGKGDQVLTQILQKDPGIAPEALLQNAELHKEGLLPWPEVLKLIASEENAALVGSSQPLSQPSEPEQPPQDEAKEDIVKPWAEAGDVVEMVSEAGQAG